MTSYYSDRCAGCQKAIPGCICLSAVTQKKEKLTLAIERLREARDKSALINGVGKTMVRVMDLDEVLFAAECQLSALDGGGSR